MLKTQLAECQFSPTYLSTNLFSPQRSPYRLTVPMMNIISEGTFSNRIPEDWGSLSSDYAGVDKHTLREDVQLLNRHRRNISGLSGVLRAVVKPQPVTNQLKSNCRLNDQHIVPPHLVTDFKIMREENKFVQEPSYSSHISRNAVFPLTSMEEHGVDRKRKIPSPPLCEKTTGALSKVLQTRYKQTSYKKDYENTAIHDHNKELQRETEKASNVQKDAKAAKKQATFTPRTLKALACRALGAWPCWPAGTCCILSTVTGQIVEKRDITSLDDRRDFRIMRRRARKQDSVEPEIENSKYDKSKRKGESPGNGNQDKNEVAANSAPSVDVDQGFQDKMWWPFEWNTDGISRWSVKTLRKWKRTYELSSEPVVVQPKAVNYTRTEEDITRGMTKEMLQKIHAETSVYLLLQSLTKNESSRCAADNAPSRNVHVCKVQRHDRHVVLPPEPLHKTLSYAGDRISHRLGVQYKTVAMKRYHGVHPETVPDLRNFRPPERKCNFLGYHTSVFR